MYTLLIGMISVWSWTSRAVPARCRRDTKWTRERLQAEPMQGLFSTCKSSNSFESGERQQPVEGNGECDNEAKNYRIVAANEQTRVVHRTVFEQQIQRHSCKKRIANALVDLTPTRNDDIQSGETLLPAILSVTGNRDHDGTVALTRHCAWTDRLNECRQIECSRLTEQVDCVDEEEVEQSHSCRQNYPGLVADWLKWIHEFVNDCSI